MQIGYEFVAYFIFCIVVATCIGLLTKRHGLSKIVTSFEERPETIKLLLAAGGAGYALFLFSESRIGEQVGASLSFRYSVQPKHLSESIDKINEIWLSDAALDKLKEYRGVLNDPKTAPIAKVKKFQELSSYYSKIAKSAEYRNSFLDVASYYQSISTCVNKGRCDTETSCELYSAPAKNFRLNFGDYISEITDVSGLKFAAEIEEFYKKCE